MSSFVEIYRSHISARVTAFLSLAIQVPSVCFTTTPVANSSVASRVVNVSETRTPPSV